MKRIGCRIICDQDGEIIDISGEMKGDVLDRKDIISLHHLDLDYGSINFITHKIVGVDLEMMKPILEELPIIETEEQKRIRELEEDVLLLQTENEIGGIL